MNSRPMGLGVRDSAPAAGGVRAAARRGAALMMVLVILALLLVLAVSFTFLMTQQEGTSVASLAGEETRIVTRTAADHAYARLNRGNRLNEFAAWWNTRPADVTNLENPWLDSYDENVVDLLYDFEGADGALPTFPGLIDPNGQPRFRVEDPRRLVLGVDVQDESGKLNLNFASPAMVANVLGSATTTEEVQDMGGVYPAVPLTDASFLVPYDENSDPTDNLFGGGYVVIDGCLFSYSTRTGNQLNNVTPNPPHNGPVTGRGENGLFPYWNPDRAIPRGAFVTTPTAYKIVYRRFLALQAAPQAGEPPLPSMFNNLGEVRQIAEMRRWFNPAGALGPYYDRTKLEGWPEGLDPVLYQRLERLGTTMAPTERHDGGWFYPHVVRFGDMFTDARIGKDFFAYTYEDKPAFQASFHVVNDPRSPNPTQLDHQRAGIQTGSLVRLRRADQPQQFYGYVFAPGRLIVAGDHTINQGEPWIVECAERAPVNINTAATEVIEAVFHGVGPRSRQPDIHPITRDQARRIAIEIRSRVRSGDNGQPQPFANLSELMQFLVELSQRDSTIITPPQINHFRMTQLFPHAGHNVVTAQFSYFGLDTFLVDAFATRYQPSGGAMARRGFREWVSIGSDRPQEYIWRDYQRWQEEMRQPQGNIFNLFDGGTENGRLIAVHELPIVHYQPDERYMRGRFDPPWSTATPRDMFAMGVDAPPPRREKFYSNVVQQTLPGGQTIDVGDLEAGMFSFWYRPQWDQYDQNHYLFDAAEQPYSNRFGLLWWGQRTRGYRLSQRNSGLVLRVKDRTLEEAFTELRFELDPSNFRTNDWYHLNLNWKGTSLSHLSMILDGDCETGTPVQRPVINHTFLQSNNAWVSRTSTLDMDLEDPRNINITQTELYLDAADINAFPQRGVVLIGDEAIEYNGNNGFALLNIYRGPPVPGGPPNSARGARGTTANSHPRGSRVTVFGYVSPVRQHFMGSNNALQPQFPRLPATGGNLRSSMGSTGIYRVSKTGSINPIYYRSRELGPDAGFPGGGDDQRGGDPNHLPLADTTGLQQRGVVAVWGFGWLGYHPPGTPGIPQAGVWFPDFDPNVPGVERALNYPADIKFEYVAYDRIDPQGLHVIQRYDQNFAPKDPATWIHFLGTYQALPEIPYNPAVQQSVNMFNFFSAGTCVVPVSIDIDNIAGYHTRSCVQVDNEWFFYNRVWDPMTNPTTDLLTLLICLDPAGVQSYLAVNVLTDTKSPAPYAGFRGYYGTGVGDHAAGNPVTPCFGSSISAGEMDVVTTINGKNGEKQLHRIRRFRNIGRGPDNVAGTFDDVCIAALYDHTAYTYQPNASYNQNNGNLNGFNAGNLCKFPTGELPVELPTTWTFAAADPRAPEATSSSANFDSFELRMYAKGNFRLLGHMSDSFPGEAGEIQVNQVASLPRPGVVKIDDELICYRMTEERQSQVILPNGTTQVVITYWLTDITRGILGTQRAAHSAGTPMMNMASLRVGQANASGTLLTNEITAIMGEEQMRPYGFIRIIDNNHTEIAGFQKQVETATPDPSDPNRQIRVSRMTAGLFLDQSQPQALFRGLYGTQARAWGTRALFFDQPVRFPDYFPGYHLRGQAAFGPWHQGGADGIPGARSPEIAFIQGSTTLRNSVFSQFKWRVAWLPHAEQARHQFGLGARLVMRFRGRGVNGGRVADWGEVPTNRPGGLYSFEFEFGGPNTQPVGGIFPTAFEQTEDLGNVRADGIEWRVYFYFKQDAFRNDLYKATLQFQGASATVTQFTDVLRHEEKR